MRVTVNVTEQHIAEGQPAKTWGARCRTCPIALALKDATRHEWEVAFTEAHRYGIQERINLPKNVTSFIFAADYGRPVGPLTFELDIPEVTL